MSKIKTRHPLVKSMGVFGAVVAMLASLLVAVAPSSTAIGVAQTTAIINAVQSAADNPPPCGTPTQCDDPTGSWSSVSSLTVRRWINSHHIHSGTWSYHGYEDFTHFTWQGGHPAVAPSAVDAAASARPWAGKPFWQAHKIVRCAISDCNPNPTLTGMRPDSLCWLLPCRPDLPKWLQPAEWDWGHSPPSSTSNQNYAWTHIVHPCLDYGGSAIIGGIGTDAILMAVGLGAKILSWGALVAIAFGGCLSGVAKNTLP